MQRVLNRSTLTVTSLLLVLSTSVMAEDPIKFAVRSSDMMAINTCHQNSKNLYPICSTCLEGVSTSGAFLNYTVLAHALHKGGLNISIVPIKSPNSERSRRYVSSGVATIRGDWDFNIDNNSDVYKTDPFILPGRIVKGIYGLSTNTHLASLKSISDLQKLSATTNPKWRLDWQILSTIGLRKLVPASTKDQMFKLVGHRGVDFTLLEFSALEDLAQFRQGVRLVPAQGVKIALPNSQHFMISKKDTRSKKILDAVNKGLAQLHKTGFIEKCIADSGIVDSRVEGWALLNPSTKPL
jgi:hypothetical protein